MYAQINRSTFTHSSRIIRPSPARRMLLTLRQRNGQALERCKSRHQKLETTPVVWEHHPCTSWLVRSMKKVSTVNTTHSSPRESISETSPVRSIGWLPHSYSSQHAARQSTMNPWTYEPRCLTPRLLYRKQRTLHQHPAPAWSIIRENGRHSFSPLPHTPTCSLRQPLNKTESRCMEITPPISHHPSHISLLEWGQWWNEASGHTKRILWCVRSELQQKRGDLVRNKQLRATMLVIPQAQQLAS